MPYEVRRDFVGYGANPPNPKWPNGARLAVNFVMNYEEGSEPSVQDGEGHTDIGLTVLDKPGRFAVFMWRVGGKGDEEFVPVKPFTIRVP